MKPITIKQADNYLRKNGYKPVRQESSHCTYSNGIKTLPPLPLHRGKDVSCGVWRSILKVLSDK